MTTATMTLITSVSAQSVKPAMFSTKMTMIVIVVTTVPRARGRLLSAPNVHCVTQVMCWTLTRALVNSVALDVKSVPGMGRLLPATPMAVMQTAMCRSYLQFALLVPRDAETAGRLARTSAVRALAV